MCVYTCQNATLLEITCRGSFSEQSNNYFFTLVGEVGLHLFYGNEVALVTAFTIAINELMS